MAFPDSPHIALGEGSQVGIITLWTRKEHVLSKVPSSLYAVASQLYSRDEGISALVRNLLADKRIRDIIIVGADLNTCAETLLALWENGVSDGRVTGAAGYVDPEIPSEAIDRLRKNVELHDLRAEKDYAKVAAFIQRLPKKASWGKSEMFPEPRITPPDVFPTAHQHAMRHESIDRAAIELAHLTGRFGDLLNVQVHLTASGKVPAELQDQEEAYTAHVLSREEGTYGERLHAAGLDAFVGRLTSEDVSVLLVEGASLDLLEVARKDGLHLSAHARTSTLSELPLLCSALFSLLETIASELDETAGTVTVTVGRFSGSPRRLREALQARAHVLRRTGDPRSNILIRIRDGRIWVTHLSPEGKRLEEFSGENARDLYKRLVVEHRITDLSHAAYLGYELARAEEALRSGGLYEQDA